MQSMNTEIELLWRVAFVCFGIVAYFPCVVIDKMQNKVAMRVLLKDIAQVQMGYSFRGRLEGDAGGLISVIQMKDLDDEVGVNLSNLVKVNADNMKVIHFVECSDLVFRSRGQTNTSVMLRDQLNKAIVAAPLLRIRSTSSRVLPQYLNWYINQHEAQSALGKSLEGSFIKMVSKKSLEELEIQVPTLDVQKAILEMDGYVRRESVLLLALMEKRKSLMQGRLLQLAHSRNN
jgi:hypothetical protein